MPAGIQDQYVANAERSPHYRADEPGSTTDMHGIRPAPEAAVEGAPDA